MKRIKLLTITLAVSTTINAYAECDIKAPGVKWNDCHVKTHHGHSISRAPLSHAQVKNTNFEGVDLSHADLSWAKYMETTNIAQASSLVGTNLAKTTLTGLDFSKKDLREVNLSHSDSRGTKFIGANVSGAYANDTDLRGADLSHAIGLNKVHHIGSARLQGANLSGSPENNTDLSGIHFSAHHYEGTNFSDSNLSNTIFHKQSEAVGASLRGAIFKGATLTNTNFDRADLDGAILSGAKGIESAIHLEWANLPRAHLSYLNLSNRNFNKYWMKDLRQTHFIGATLIGTQLNNINLTWAYFTRADVKDANFSGSNLDGADFRDAKNMDKAHGIEQAYLVRANLSSVTLKEEINFSHKDLNQTKFHHSTLKKANLYYAALIETEFHGADLSGANLFGANINGTSFFRANLRGADLRNTHANYATSFTGADLSGAKWNIYGKICAEGSIGECK